MEGERGDCYVARYHQFATRPEAVTFFTENESACLLYEGEAPKLPVYVPPTDIRPVYVMREVKRAEKAVKSAVKPKPCAEAAPKSSKPALTLEDI
jgi:hypothetical protein